MSCDQIMPVRARSTVDRPMVTMTSVKVGSSTSGCSTRRLINAPNNPASTRAAAKAGSGDMSHIVTREK